MGIHKLNDGLNIIQFITDLGDVLGYKNKKEYPIEISGKSTKNIPAVDIAWFIDGKNEFPLFIFEIESKATNSMVYNPMKVFSKPTEKFEKPLFLFQIILSGGKKSSRTEDLRNEYGKMNYKLYILNAENNLSEVVIDIVSQHRRLQLKIDIYQLLSMLRQYNLDIKEIIKISEHIERKNFTNTEDFLPGYAKYYLDTNSPGSFNNYLRYLNLWITKEKHHPISNYRTYWGNTWSYPFHLGLLAHNSDNYTEKMKLFQNYYEWQENNAYLNMIAPKFGLNFDYDQFLVWMSGAMIAIISFLFREIEDSTTYRKRSINRTC